MRNSGLSLITISATAAWVDGARAAGRRVTKWVGKCGLARDRETVKIELQTLAGEFRLSQNGLKMLVDVRVLMQHTLSQSALILFLSLSAAAQACIYQGSTTPCPADCIEDGGEIMCIKPVPAASPGGPVERDEQKWLYANSWYPGRDEDPFYWCLAGGGQIVANSVPNTCSSLPSGYIGYGSAYFVEGLVFPAASAFAKFLYCPYSGSNDSGWGKENFDGAFAYAAQAKTKTIGGVEVQSYRRMIFSGATPKKPDGSCDMANPVNVTIDAVKYRDARCPAGYEQREIGTSIYDANRNVKCAKVKQATCERPEDQCGNPIQLSTRAKTQTESDYQSASDSLLVLRRTYNSEGFFSSDGSLNGTPRNFGRFWRHKYERRIQQVLNSSSVSAIAERADGKFKTFDANGNEMVNFGSAREKLVAARNASQLIGWTYTTSVDEVESYDGTGRLISITSRNGKKQFLTYSNAMTPASDAPFAGLLIAVSDDFGRSIRFAYNSNALIRQVTNPKGDVSVYVYDSQNNITQVTWPDQKTRTYVYGETVNTSNELLPNALTGIIDENTNRFSTYAYRGGAAYSTEYAGGVNKYVVSDIYGGIYVWDPLDTSSLLGYPKRSYGFVNINGVLRLSNTSRPASEGTGTAGSYFSHDAAGNTERVVDYNNNQTCYQFDAARNLESARVEGLSSGYACSSALNATTVLPTPARKITTTWHPTYRLPATITEPSAPSGTKTTTNTYDANGNLTQRTVTTPGGTRTWQWSNYDAYGRPGTATDPRGKITTSAYYPNTAAQNVTLPNSRGMLQSITNAVGHVTTITGYNPHGQPLAMTDANGLATSMTYDARMRLKSRTVSGTGINETTAYDYDGVGLLIKVTLPDASFITYTYDGAHRLVKITDTLNNSIVYTLDAMGNRIGEAAKDPAGALTRSHTREIDALNRLKKDIGATNPTTQFSTYSYDNNGNQKTMTDALGRVTDNEYDALNRLTKVTDAASPTRGITQYAYDDQDNLTKVTDAKNLGTVYVYNGFNELTSQTSPDTGTTAFTYDAAGNMLTKTDARGVVATYTYDGLNRVTTVSYTAYQTDPAETVTYTYDTGCGNTISSLGRLCSLADKTGTTTYSYDLMGRMTAKRQNVAGVTQTISYRYNAAGQMDEMTLPSTKKVAYSYTNNRITGITYDGTPIVKAGVYEPFGSIGEWVWGNNSAVTPNKHSRDYDLDGRLFRIDTGLTNGAIEPNVILYNDVNQITGLQRLAAGASGTTGPVNLTKSNSYGYDNLDRLTAVIPASGNPNPALSYSYDAIGNRLAAVVGTSTTAYGYGTSSHRLNNLTGATAKTYSYDAAGNRTSDGSQTWNYGGNNRPVSITAGGATIDARINALGQRVTKTVNGVLTRFVYDEAGRLLGEYNDTGQPLQETIWFNDLPVAVIK